LRRPGCASQFDPRDFPSPDTTETNQSKVPWITNVRKLYLPRLKQRRECVQNRFRQTDTPKSTDGVAGTDQPDRLARRHNLTSIA